MEGIDSQTHGSLWTIRAAWVDKVCSQEERACFMLSHGEESGRDVDEWREAREEDGPHCPIFLMSNRGWGHSSSRQRPNEDQGDERESVKEDRQDESSRLKKGKEDALKLREEKESGSERERREEKK